ncbi:MAG: nuclear transport factor 2 family protein, partial [Pseudomonadota bacterium]|nr:nuclear transport factor 2 family protein [Pseudomonadota bacterium]
DATLEWGGSGVYAGKDRILAYFNTWGAEGPQQGILNDHMQLQPVITVSADGMTAQGRWHHFSQEAVHGESHFWGTGIYENEYRYEDGVWKISKLHLYSTMRTPYDDGWAVTALPRTTPSQDLPPDQPPSVDYENYPAVFVPPFHFTNPGVAPAPRLRNVTGASMSAEQIAAALDALDTRVARLQDADAVERLHTIYGYYLQRNQWDDLTGIFTPDGTIEIAMRGVYRGAASIRRNLDLYGVQDELPGTLHNHMQYQPVIHIAPDGQSALMRSRAFSMMGEFGGVGRWMGGTYENIFEKRDGVWMLHKDQQINTYFAVYDTGWKDLAPRPPPGITDANPPDEPPTLPFEMYPSAFLPPYHYANPVTGRQ